MVAVGPRLLTAIWSLQLRSETAHCGLELAVGQEGRQASRQEGKQAGRQARRKEGRKEERIAGHQTLSLVF